MEGKEYTLEDFSFDLPESLIAQRPSDRRDASRLFLLDRSGPHFSHARFSDLPESLRAGDVLVFNDARVWFTRLYLRRSTGAVVEVVLTERISERLWRAITNRTKRLTPGERLESTCGSTVHFMVMEKAEGAIVLETDITLDESLLQSIGRIPLPPYIKRASDEEDASRYQTVYARAGGAAAAPTAGLHFTEELLERLGGKGVQLHYLTLNVSWGTFQPVRESRLADHKMHAEAYCLPGETAAAVNLARKEGRRVIAVGTTVLRVLETTFGAGKNTAGEGITSIFIRPPDRVHSCDGLITNFHTPGSTLLMLVSAFAGFDVIRAAYAEAVREGYRFFSYGDSMFIY